jgi:hypothetical protein
MKILASMVFLGLLVSCGGSNNASLRADVNCTVSSQGNLTTITCPDGSQSIVVNGKDGTDGVDGQDGSDGIDGKDGVNGQDGRDGVDGMNGVIVDVINPCGDAPQTEDEILFLLDNGGVIAYFEHNGNRRLSLLEPNKRYQTTDGDKCKFEFDASGTLTYESHNS